MGVAEVFDAGRGVFRVLPRRRESSQCPIEDHGRRFFTTGEGGDDDCAKTPQF